MTPSKKFLKLQKQWYKKLAQSGFDDLEKVADNGISSLKQWGFGTSSTTNSLRQRKEIKHVESEEEHTEISMIFEEDRQHFDSTLDYYRAVGFFLYQFKFKSDLDKEIWDLHSNGAELQEICFKILKDKKFSHSSEVRLLAQIKISFKRLKRIFLEWVKEENKNGASK